MKHHRLFADATGESHWDEIDVTLTEQTFAPPAKAIEISDPEAATQSLFLRLAPGWDEPVHTSPIRQNLICLTGTVRVTASDGEYREIGPGDVWLMEDSTGKGHHTAVISEEAFTCVIVQYA